MSKALQDWVGVEGEGAICPTTIVVVVAVAWHGLWWHTNHNLHNNERNKRSNFIVCTEGMMSNQLHGVVLMVLLFDVLVFIWFSLESSQQWWSDGAGCGLRRSYIGQVLLCGDDWWRWPVPPAIPHLWQFGAKKQYYSVIFSITAVTCNLDLDIVSNCLEIYVLGIFSTFSTLRS